MLFRYDVDGFCSYEIFLVASYQSGLIEINVTHLVKAKVLDNFIAPLEVKVRNVFLYIDDLVDVHKVNDFKHVLFYVNRTVEVLTVNTFNIVLQLVQFPSKSNK